MTSSDLDDGRVGHGIVFECGVDECEEGDAGSPGKFESKKMFDVDFTSFLESISRIYAPKLVLR